MFLFSKKMMKFRLLGAGGGLLVVSIYLALFVMPKTRALYSDKAATAEGVVTEKGTREGRNGTEYLVRLQFKDARGQTHEVENKYHACRWEAIPTGQKLPVRYLIAEPEFAFAEGARGGHKPDPKSETLTLGGMALAACAFLTIGVRMRV
jgi:Protein of unknown function (DUF3592)